MSHYDPLCFELVRCYDSLVNSLLMRHVALFPLAPALVQQAGFIVAQQKGHYINYQKFGLLLSH